MHLVVGVSACAMFDIFLNFSFYWYIASFYCVDRAFSNNNEVQVSKKRENEKSNKKWRLNFQVIYASWTFELTTDISCVYDFTHRCVTEEDRTLLFWR